MPAYQSHLDALASTIREIHPVQSSDEETPRNVDSDYELELLIAATNQEAFTYDGIDWGSERIVTEASSFPIVTGNPLAF